MRHIQYLRPTYIRGSDHTKNKKGAISGSVTFSTNIQFLTYLFSNILSHANELIKPKFNISINILVEIGLHYICRQVLIPLLVSVLDTVTNIVVLRG